MDILKMILKYHKQIKKYTNEERKKQRRDSEIDRHYEDYG